MPWYVLRVKPKSEKKSAEELEKLQIETYCPVRTEVRQWSDRKKKVSVPLFVSYVFVNLPEKERDQVFQIPSVLRYLHWLGKPAIVKDAEIETIKTWLNGDTDADLRIENFSPGQEFTISNGSFKNEKAIIKETGNKRLKLLLPSLGYTLSVRISDIL